MPKTTDYAQQGIIEVVDKERLYFVTTSKSKNKNFYKVTLKFMYRQSGDEEIDDDGNVIIKWEKATEVFYIRTTTGWKKKKFTQIFRICF